MRKSKKKHKYKNKKKIQKVIDTKMKVIQKRKHTFKYGIGHLLFFQKRSNVSFVLKTEKNKHVITLSSGSCKVGSTKKQKISPFNLNIIIKRLKEYLNLYNIYRIRLFFRSFINKHYYHLIKNLSLFHIKVMEIGYVLHFPHNGMRKRKSRRI
jgi:ribosomal protein S11